MRPVAGAFLFGPIALLSTLVPTGVLACGQDEMAGDAPLEVWIAGRGGQESAVEITGGVSALSDIAGTAELVVERQSASGTIATRQARAFSLVAGQSETVGTVSINYLPQDNIKLVIVATSADQQLPQLEILFPENESFSDFDYRSSC